MPSFPDTAVLVILALLLFGPKKLPVLARQLGKLMADFRRASNEFRTQMEEELRISEQADRQKQIAAIEAAAPTPEIAAPTETTSPDTESESPHEPPPASTFASTSESDSAYSQDYPDQHYPDQHYPDQGYPDDSPTESESAPDSSPAPLPIATSGDLSILPPSTGLPIANSGPTGHASADPGPSHIPDTPVEAHEPELETETLHG